MTIASAEVNVAELHHRRDQDWRNTCLLTPVVAFSLRAKQQLVQMLAQATMRGHFSVRHDWTIGLAISQALMCFIRANQLSQRTLVSNPRASYLVHGGCQHRNAFSCRSVHDRHLEQADRKHSRETMRRHWVLDLVLTRPLPCEHCSCSS